MQTAADACLRPGMTTTLQSNLVDALYYARPPIFERAQRVITVERYQPPTAFEVEIVGHFQFLEDSF